MSLKLKKLPRDLYLSRGGSVDDPYNPGEVDASSIVVSPFRVSPDDVHYRLSYQNMEDLSVEQRLHILRRIIKSFRVTEVMTPDDWNFNSEFARQLDRHVCNNPLQRGAVDDETLEDVLFGLSNIGDSYSLIPWDEGEDDPRG